jgi:hypothetical protein
MPTRKTGTDGKINRLLSEINDKNAPVKESAILYK